MDKKENGFLEGLKTGAALGGIFLLVCFGIGVWDCMCNMCEENISVGGGCVCGEGFVSYVIDDWRFIFIFLGIMFGSGLIGLLYGVCSEKQEKSNSVDGTIKNRANDRNANAQNERNLFYKENVWDYYEKLRRRELEIMPSTLMKNPKIEKRVTYEFNYPIEKSNSLIFDDSIFNEQIQSFDNYWRSVCQKEYEFYTLLVQKLKIRINN